MKECKIDGCEKKAYCRGWCKRHYQCWYNYDDVNYNSREFHGYAHHPLYDVWAKMKQRCYNDNNPGYENYGGRGITVCDEWMSPKTFIEWALPKWKLGLQIDRRDNDGNYEPSNCRFVIRLDNIHNNRLLISTNTSGYRGVCYDKSREKWISQIVINNKHIFIGRFNTSEEAAIAYDKAVPDERPRNFS